MSSDSDDPGDQVRQVIHEECDAIRDAVPGANVIIFLTRGEPTKAEIFVAHSLGRSATDKMLARFMRQLADGIDGQKELPADENGVLKFGLRFK